MLFLLLAANWVDQMDSWILFLANVEDATTKKRCIEITIRRLRYFITELSVIVEENARQSEQKEEET